MSGTRDRSPRQRRGRLANLSGAMAEDLVADRLQAQGMKLLHRRWRGASGEVDLIARDGACMVFVEVKQARSHDVAAQRLNRAQMDRICNAAIEYCAALPSGMDSEMRFDAALVDAMGRVEIIRNAFAGG
ncbi:YraN family protein [Paracoccus seriniphilus]|uniref:YraN family protein n=1 Tax=Paracoccus seriniphilus TaxID=184748 RepID=UPI003568BD9B